MKLISAVIIGTAHLCLVTKLGFVRERHLDGIQNDLIAEDRLLRLIVAKRLMPKHTLIEYNTNRPDVHLGGNLWRPPSLKEALRGKVPVRARALHQKRHDCRR